MLRAVGGTAVHPRSIDRVSSLAGIAATVNLVAGR